RKDHTFHWQFDHCIDSYGRKYDFKSVKHINICGKRAVNNSVIYFSNVTELTVKNYGKIYYGSMLIALHQILPLKQLKKLIIDCNDFPVQKVINLLNLTPNLCFLKWNFQSIDQKSLQTEVFRKQIVQITRCLLSKMDHLFFLHITNIIKTYLQKLNFLIKSENLLDDYLIKFIDHDLY
ncbi:unnamed protein product, partial [Rotaria sp. Silwood1]